MNQESQPSSPHRAGHGATPVLFDATSKLAAILIGAAAVIAGLAAGLRNPFLAGAASSQGAAIDALFSIMLGIAAVIFVVVQGFLIYSIIRFGRPAGDETDGPPIRGNASLEVIWTGIPAAIVVFLALFSYRVLADIERPHGDEMIVEVTARQYAWEFYYPTSDIQSNELHIPLGRQVLLKMRSTDVIHAFWVPEFRIKKDVMPDRITEARITGVQLGTYPVVCTELCGAGHAVMRGQVVVQSDGDFRIWTASLAAGKLRAPADPLAYGRELYNRLACNSCHALTDAAAAGQIGPSLDGIGGRAGATVSGQSAEEYVRLAIVKPNAYLVPKYQPVMPGDYGLRMSDAELAALVQYLLTQK